MKIRQMFQEQMRQLKEQIDVLLKESADRKSNRSIHSGSAQVKDFSQRRGVLKGLFV